jgi:uncharacterized protein
VEDDLHQGLLVRGCFAHVTYNSKGMMAIADSSRTTRRATRPGFTHGGMMAEEMTDGFAGCEMDADGWGALLHNLRGLGGMTLAFSGGVDSRFLAHAALCAGAPLKLVHVSGPHVAPSDTAYARQSASDWGVPLHVVNLDPLALGEVASGDRQRCYACKFFLFSRIRMMAEGVLCDGSNASDAGRFRPGMRALRELGVRSPLAEAGLDKDAIRTLARRTGLDRPWQPSRACLLTRLPYGMAPSRELLARLAGGEQIVEDVLRDAGYDDIAFRLRVCGENRFELHIGLNSVSRDLADMLRISLHAAGFSSILVRSMDRVSGYFDQAKTL